MEKGKLIVSTKSAEKARKTIIIISGGLFLLFGITFFIALLALDGLAEEMSRDLLGSSSLSFVFLLIPIGMIAYACYNLAVVFLSSKSYCDVYEFAVEGVSALSRTNPNSPMQHFEIPYQEIMNVTESGKTLYIYTQYTTYEVLAMKNRAEALKEIRARMSRGGK